MSNSSRYRSLDVWRGIACLMVVIHHSVYFAAAEAKTETDLAAWLVRFCSHGWVGVPMFFVISGYCISATVESSMRRGDSATTYFLRRFHRIYPPYWVAMLIYLMIALVWPIAVGTTERINLSIPSPHEVDASQWIGNLTLTESWRSHIVGGPRMYFVEQSWTLCYEEQFYFVMGAILLLVPRHFFAASAAVTAATVATRLLSKQRGINTDGFFFDGLWLLFACGILIYHQLNRASSRSRTAAMLLLWIMATALLIATFRDPNHIGSAPGKLFIAVAFSAILMSVYRWDNAIMQSAAIRPLNWCGKRCYSLYLVHMPIAVGVSNALHNEGVRGSAVALLITVPVCLAASIIAADIFHRNVEARFLNS